MKRGDLVTVALSGDYGKPRPALVIQADDFVWTQSVIVLPLTSTLVDASMLRVTVEADHLTGLERRSQIMVEEPHSLPRAKLGPVIGAIDSVTMRSVEKNLRLILSLGSESYALR